MSSLGEDERKREREVEKERTGQAKTESV